MSRRERRLLRRKGKRFEESEAQPTAPSQAEEETKEASKEVRRKSEHGSGLKGRILDVYDKQYKKLMIIPFIILILSIIVIIGNIATTGDFINKGISLKGGMTLTVTTDQDINIDDFQKYLREQLPQGDVGVRKLSQAGTAIGFIVDAADIEEKDLMAAVETRTGPLEKGKYSVEQMGSALGASFFRETIIALLVAFLFMGLVVTLYFKVFIPSMAVILCAFSDIVGTIAIVDLLGIKISTAGIAAFLMLIGYSVDTDILLSTRVLKRQEGTVFQRVIDAFGTGMTMTGTTLAALIVVLIVTQSEVLRQIMFILLIGLVLDIINTWIQNVGILRWYVEKHPEKIKKIKSN